MIIADAQRPHTAIELPPLSDDAVVQIHRFLEELLGLFESRYHGQIYRYYEAMSASSINEQHAARDNDDEPPF